MGIETAFLKIALAVGSTLGTRVRSHSKGSPVRRWVPTRQLGWTGRRTASSSSRPRARSTAQGSDPAKEKRPNRPAARALSSSHGQAPRRKGANRPSRPEAGPASRTWRPT